MKIARWELVRGSSDIWTWVGIGLRGDVVARSSKSFKTREECEDDMVAFKEERKRNPCKVCKKTEPKSLSKRFLEWIGKIWLTVRR